MKSKKTFLTSATATLALATTLFPISASAQEEKPAERARVSAAEVDPQAKHLFDKAMELMDYKQHERGLAMLNSIVRDNQGTLLAHRAHMAMGKHFLEQRVTADALNHFMLLTRVLAPVPGEKQSEDEISLYQESLFQSGLTQYTAGQYAAAFPMFRRLTEVAGKTTWANQAYFYIGMSHYHMGNWNKAIDSLSLVGTEVADSEGDDLGRIEIGQRFYAKIVDADVPVMRKLNQPIQAMVKVSSGDSEIITGAPVPGKDNEMLASAPTALGNAKANDGILQMVGGDTLEVTYIDDSTLDGQKGVSRSGKVRAVSTGTVGFYLGDNSTPAYIAYPGQPQVVMLRDADLDTSPAAQSITLTIKSFFKAEAKDGAEGAEMLDIFALKDDEKDKWVERDSITVTLTETGEGPEIRSGVFLGKIPLAPLTEGLEPTNKDQVLHTAELDELSISYTDAVHLYGDDPRDSESRIKVSGSVNSGVTADQYVVFEELLKARKGSVEAEALVGLGSIYKDMGLDQRAAERANESLNKIDPIIVNRQKLPGDLVEQAFKLKWESELLKNDFTSAMATCLAFNRLYPESVLADQALMTLGRSLADRGEYKQAVDVYGRVLQLENPISAAEAQFRIGEVLAKEAEELTAAADEHNSKWGKAGLNPATALQSRMAPAINAYQKTYQTYPESSYAAEALGRVVRHYVETDSFAQAAGLLESVFAEYPDAAFLDEMLLLWANVAFRMNDAATAKAKLQQLLFDYPNSQYVAEARKRIAGLEGEAKPKEE
jgi:TolA-binding protein